MIVKILGSGCSNCKRLEALTREAATQSGLSPTFEKVTGIPDIMAYGVMHTPALVIDERVVASGRVPSQDELKGWLREGSA
jgi:small redox-active disulfide protein 2